ncbi:GIY-YIG nuclease family protein [Xanthobacteraceae bacterium Astr-EGSB]|uniref:GIY-YIG nuclease family protein n=1 Tax=Astrobacterium formosum TaxID=3069710 RepID=UPI0027B805AA|nr:GIY-YIG nuclease family protein [Xanthobacteraceae bacterium Astr-EGSB]
MGAWLYVLKCSDGSYYTGTTRANLEQRVAQHQAGEFDGYTSTRRPVTLVFSESFEQITDAIAAERQIKGWSRAKKEALIAGDFARVQAAARRRQAFGPHPSRRAPSGRSSG